MERDSTGLSDWRPICTCWKLRISDTLYQLRLHCRRGKQFWSESQNFKHLCKLYFGSSDYLFLYSALFAVSSFLPLWPANCELRLKERGCGNVFCVGAYRWVWRNGGIVSHHDPSAVYLSLRFVLTFVLLLFLHFIICCIYLALPS